jgi:hypothetical protein
MNSEFGDFFGGRAESQPLLGTGDGGFMRLLEGDASDTNGVAGGGSRQRTLPAAQGEVSGSRTAIAIHAVFHEVGNQAIIRKAAQEGFFAPLHLVKVIRPDILAGGGVYTRGSHIETSFVPGYGCVRMEWEGGGFRLSYIGGQGQLRMRRRHKSRHCITSLVETELAFRVYAPRPPTR